MRDKHWKNCPPQETIATITSILQKYGIELRLEWYNDDNPLGVYSNFVRPFGLVKGIKSAGKGITPAYAQASGYAEFIERFQTFMMYYRSYDEPYFKDEFYDEKDKVCKYKYLDLLTGNTATITSALCYSTGMASGNTDEEAIVHAICELVERQTTMDFCNGTMQVNSSLPLDAFDFDFSALENLMNGRVQLYDVGKFGIPTVAMLCRNEMTKQMLFKIDCGPTIELAVERCLTEFFQNNAASDMRYYYWEGNSPKVDPDTLYGIIVDFHLGPIPKYALAQIEDAPVKEMMIDYSFNSEKDLIQQFIKAAKEEYHYSGVFLRDFKWAGFPTVYLVVPELIGNEHPQKTGGNTFLDSFSYLISEHEHYDGSDIRIPEFLARELLIMYFGKSDPTLMKQRYNDGTERNLYTETTNAMLEKMKKDCANFELDVQHFSEICLGTTV